jgi:hypothetical protein
MPSTIQSSFEHVLEMLGHLAVGDLGQIMSDLADDLGANSPQQTFHRKRKRSSNCRRRSDLVANRSWMRCREFSDRVLDISVLSSLLWAAFGINRADGRHTSPSAVLQCFALAEARRSAADASLPKGGIHPLGLSGQRIPVLGAQVLSLIMRANGWSCSSLEPKTFTPASATA